MERPAPRFAVLIPFGIVTLIWGSTWIVIHDQLSVVPPIWSVTYRFATAGVTMLGYALIRRERFVLDARGLRFAALVGLLQFTGNYNFVYLAEQHVTSGLVAVVFALLLVPNALLARIFLGHRLGRQLLIGSAVAMAGVALLFLHEAHDNPAAIGEVLKGIGFALAAVSCASIANVMQASRTARDLPIGSTLATAMLIGGGVDALLALAFVGPPVFEHRLGYWAGTIYLGVIASAIAFTLYFGVIRAIGPARAAYSSVIIPVLAMGFSTLFEHYRWSALALAGGALTLIGLVVALRGRR